MNELADAFETPAAPLLQSAFQGNNAERAGLLRRVGRILLFGFLSLGFANFTVRSFLAFGHGMFLYIGRQMYGLCCFACSDAWAHPVAHCCSFSRP